MEGRLGEAWVVSLLVALAAVADQIDHDIAPKPLPVVHGEAADTQHRLDVIAVNVEDRSLDCLGDVCAVAAGARLRGWRGEADLVVNDKVHCPAAAVALQL